MFTDKRTVVLILANATPCHEAPMYWHLFRSNFI